MRFGCAYPMVSHRGSDLFQSDAGICNRAEHSGCRCEQRKADTRERWFLGLRIGCLCWRKRRHICHTRRPPSKVFHTSRRMFSSSLKSITKTNIHNVLHVFLMRRFLLAWHDELNILATALIQIELAFRTRNHRPLSIVRWWWTAHLRLLVARASCPKRLGEASQPPGRV